MTSINYLMIEPAENGWFLSEQTGEKVTRYVFNTKKDLLEHIKKASGDMKDGRTGTEELL